MTEIGLERHQRRLLTELAANEKSPVLAEMAKELLAGRLTPAQILSSRAYDEALGPGAEALSSWYATTSEEERQAKAEQGHAELVRLAEDEPVPSKPRFRAPEPDQDMTEQTWSRDSW
ncbi:hypothetical protein [Lentzea sp. NPDC051838]|uniref:hypothetical protein n=1 Tax=Lentzea sp. NPDC051838 TaxID=3154849 RepID=UPI0034335A72